MEDLDQLECTNIANEMSCDAQITLAKKQSYMNFAPMAYRIDHPVCQRFHQISDKGMEHMLIKPMDTSKKACLTFDPNFKNGPWKNQFKNLTDDELLPATTNIVYTRFDEQTKAKTRSLQKGI